MMFVSAGHGFQDRRLAQIATEFDRRVGCTGEKRIMSAALSGPLTALASLRYVEPMTDTESTNATAGPCEVWLTRAVNGLTITCRVVHPDESVETLAVESLSMRGAMREVTGDMIASGYRPVGRWQAGDDAPNAPSDAGEVESFRVFRR